METKNNLINIKNILIIALGISISLNLALAGFLYKTNLKLKASKLQTASLKQKEIKTIPSWDNDNFPKDISTEINQPIGKKNNEVNLQFDNSDKTTFDRITYAFKGDKFIYLKLNMQNNIISGSVQKIKEESDNYLDFIYEGVLVKPFFTLLKELEQNIGVYPRSIYSEQYEIFKNKNNIKMKKQYLLVPGYITYKIEFISEIPYDPDYRYRYYTFSTHFFSADMKNFDETEFYKDSTNWVKRNPQENFKTLDDFIDTIGN